MGYRFTTRARSHLVAILRQSATAHGEEAAGRYRLLIQAALAAITKHPDSPGASSVEGLPQVYAYPIRLKRQQLDPKQRVASPRHVLVYRVGSDGVVEILTLVHDRMLLARAALRAVRDADRE